MGNCESELQNAYDDVILNGEPYYYQFAFGGEQALPKQFPHMVIIHIYIYIKIKFVCRVKNHTRSYYRQCVRRRSFVVLTPLLRYGFYLFCL